jgi:hypothetical protein
MKKRRGRDLKKHVNELLMSSDLAFTLNELNQLPALKVINILFSFLLNTDPKIKWTTVTLMGAFVNKIADENIEAARVIVRRLMWNLNDESGGIGWGSPEAMGEILACHEKLAEEYYNILISYLRQDENYLENEVLQRGLLWGIGRLAQKRPRLIQDSAQDIVLYLKSNDVVKRGLAIWIVGMLGIESSLPILDKFKNDEAEIQLYMNQGLLKRKIKDLSLEAISKIKSVRNTEPNNPKSCGGLKNERKSREGPQ